MARADEAIRRELGEERERLKAEVETLRGEVGEATDIRGKLRAKLPVAVAGALGLGFAAAGGLGATGRLLAGRRRSKRS